MKITIEGEYSKYSVETKVELKSIESLIGGLVIPVLLASGYSDISIDMNLSNMDECIEEYAKEAFKDE